MKSKDAINEIPLCPKCQKPTDRRCHSWMERENGVKYLHSEWTCEGCKTKYTAKLNLDNKET